MDELMQPGVWLRSLLQTLSQSRERRLIWVQGPADFTRSWRESALATVDQTATLHVGADAVPPARARNWLGQEFTLLVWDARAGFHPDGFGALAGTLRGGGVLLLLTPGVADWPRFADPDYARLADVPEVKHYLARAARILQADSSVLSVTAGHPLPDLPQLTTVVAPILPTRDQQNAIEAIKRVRRGHRRRPLVMTADRGRGKSAALGLAAAELIIDEPLNVIVTSLRPHALDVFWKHAGSRLGNTALPDPESQPELKHGDGSIRYLPPARILDELPAADLLLVDEAAAIPVPILMRLLDHYARIVFASTVHGYEGSGRGFALRFQRYLAVKTPQWQSLTLNQPVRWAASDPLEPLLNRLLLLDADLPVVPDAQDVEFISWERESRISDEKRLSEVFGLLVNAHYQTSPDDLRLLLDDCSSHCWLAVAGATVVGAIWVMEEGGLTPDLALEVRRGERRTRGQLLPQALAAYGGDAQAATLKYWRIVRIAVHPEARRRGVGRGLVDLAGREAKKVGIDVLGTSFASDAALLCFWRQCRLKGLRLGLRRDSASGAHSLMLGQGLTAAGELLCQGQRQRFAEYWPLLLATDLAALEPELVWLLSEDWCPMTPWSDQDALEAGDFANANRPLALTRLALQRLTWRQSNRAREQLGADAALWCRAVLQQVPDRKLQAEGLATGQREMTSRLRRAARKLLGEDSVSQ